MRYKFHTHKPLQHSQVIFSQVRGRQESPSYSPQVSHSPSFTSSSSWTSTIENHPPVFSVKLDPMSDSESSPRSAASLSPILDNSGYSESDNEIQLQSQRRSTKSPSSVRSVPLRPTRVRKLPPKLRDTEAECGQTGKEITVKPSHLAPEDDGHLSKCHFVPGHGLMLEEGSKSYPVQFVMQVYLCIHANKTLCI